MPDIAMCGDDDCPARHRCYRYSAIPNGKYQGYADFRHDSRGFCDSRMWMSDAEKKELRKQKRKLKIKNS